LFFLRCFFIDMASCQPSYVVARYQLRGCKSDYSDT
jgi:hypothetical protein